MSDRPTSVPKLILVLDNIRSLYNVGALFRLAHGLGINTLYLCGITPTPPRKEIHKTALGAEVHVRWTHFTTIGDALYDLQQKNYHITALEIANGSVALESWKPQFPLALVVGHERLGVDKQVLDMSDESVIIPMHGHTNSLNVATATAIALWHITRQI